MGQIFPELKEVSFVFFYFYILSSLRHWYCSKPVQFNTCFPRIPSFTGSAFENKRKGKSVLSYCSPFHWLCFCSREFGSTLLQYWSVFGYLKIIEHDQSEFIVSGICGQELAILAVFQTNSYDSRLCLYINLKWLYAIKKKNLKRNKKRNLIGLASKNKCARFLFCFVLFSDGFLEVNRYFHWRHSVS